MVTDRCTLDVSDLVALARSKYGKDLSKYRPSCIGRRVSHRMAALGISDFEEYKVYLAENPVEAEKLLEAATIHVTSFFRDREVFDTLCRKIFRDLFEKKLSFGHRVFRVWSAGCSTGEETYSMAMILKYFIREMNSDIKPEIFGTDISEESCKTAMKGVYDARKLHDVPLHLRRRYFKIDGSSCIVSPEIRHCTKFRIHDLFSKSPFSTLDLVVCRNVLIHFEYKAREIVLKNFHFSLNDEGILVLGRSEAVTGPGLELFALVDPRNKIYRKRIHPHC